MVLALCSQVLTGCWDREELEDYAFTTVVGLDKGKQTKEKTAAVRVTYQIAKPRRVEEQRNVQGSSETITLETKALFLSRNLANMTVSRRLNLVHTKVLVISEELARQGKLINTIESLIRDREFRRDIFVIICKGTAEAFIKENKAQLEKVIYKQYEMIVQTGKDIGVTPYMQLQNFLSHVMEPTALATTVYAGVRETADLGEGKGTDDIMGGDLSTRSKNPIQFAGSAVFQGQQMIGTITAAETKMMLTLQGKLETFDMVFHHPVEKNRFFAAHMNQQEEPSYDIDMSKDPYQIRVNVPLDVDLAGITAEKNYVRTEAAITQLEVAMNMQLKQRTEKFINKAQEQLKGDLFDFDRRARMQCWTDQEWRDKKWEKHFPKAQIKLQYQCKIRRTGRELGDPNKRYQ